MSLKSEPITIKVNMPNIQNGKEIEKNQADELNQARIASMNADTKDKAQSTEFKAKITDRDFDSTDRFLSLIIGATVITMIWDMVLGIPIELSGLKWLYGAALGHVVASKLAIIKGYFK